MTNNSCIWCLIYFKMKCFYYKLLNYLRDIIWQDPKIMYEMDKKCKENSGIRIISVWKIRTFWGKSHKCTYVGSKTVKLDAWSENWYGSHASLLFVDAVYSSKSNCLFRKCVRYIQLGLKLESYSVLCNY